MTDWILKPTDLPSCTDDILHIDSKDGITICTIVHPDNTKKYRVWDKKMKYWQEIINHD